MFPGAMYKTVSEYDEQHMWMARIYKLGRRASIADLQLLHDALDAIVRNDGLNADEVRNHELWTRANDA